MNTHTFCTSDKISLLIKIYLLLQSNRVTRFGAILQLYIFRVYLVFVQILNLLWQILTLLRFFCYFKWPNIEEIPTLVTQFRFMEEMQGLLLFCSAAVASLNGTLPTYTKNVPQSNLIFKTSPKPITN